MATYRLIRKLAVGGMAEVFLAKVVGAEGCDKSVAVKRILPSMARDREFVELFLREARLTVCLQHPNVVQVLDLGALEGQYYMVMEWVEGENLRALQRGAAARGLLLGLREVCFIVQQLAEGLAYAHGRVDAAGRPLHIIHRDVNPSNVLVSSRGEVKLADFGIAKALNAQSGTQVGVVKGKAGYLAPEQVKGAEVDQRADLFLTGLLLYELLSGRQLFQGTDSFQTLRAIAQFDVRRLVPLPGVPAALWSIITRALAPDPAARFQRARDLADALRDFLFEHRLRVGPQDVVALFQRCLPGRRSLLEGVDGGSPEALGEEIRLGSDVGLQRPTPLTSVRSRPPFLGGPRPGTPTPVRTQTEPGRAPVSALPASTGVLELATRVMRPAHRKLGEMLLVFGKVSEPQLRGALERQRCSGGRIGELLVAEGLLSEEDVVRALSEQSGIPFISDRVLRSMPVPRVLLPLLPLEKAERLEVVPVSQQAGVLVCAMREPRDLARLDELKLITGQTVRGIYATQSALRRAIGRFYRGEAVQRAGESFQRVPAAGSDPRQGAPPPGVRPGTWSARPRAGPERWAARHAGTRAWWTRRSRCWEERGRGAPCSPVWPGMWRAGWARLPRRPRAPRRWRMPWRSRPSRSPGGASLGPRARPCASSWAGTRRNWTASSTPASGTRRLPRRPPPGPCWPCPPRWPSWRKRARPRSGRRTCPRPSPGYSWRDGCPPRPGGPPRGGAGAGDRRVQGRPGPDARPRSRELRDGRLVMSLRREPRAGGTP